MLARGAIRPLKSDKGGMERFNRELAVVLKNRRLTNQGPVPCPNPWIVPAPNQGWLLQSVAPLCIRVCQQAELQQFKGRSQKAVEFRYHKMTFAYQVKQTPNVLWLQQ